MALTIVPTYCALCISRCGCLATVEDGRLLRIYADPLHPTLRRDSGSNALRGIACDVRRKN